MRKATTFLAAAAMVAAFAVAGCDKDDTVSQKAEQAKDQAADATSALKDSAQKAADTASGEVKAAADAAADKASEVAASATEAVKKQAQELYDKAMAMVNEKKFADAEGLLSQLDALKSQLSPEWQGKIDSLKSAIEQGKKALQALPGGGN